MVKKIKNENKSTSFFRVVRSLWKPGIINKTMNPIFGHGHEIQELKFKTSNKYCFLLISSFLAENRGRQT